MGNARNTRPLATVEIDGKVHRVQRVPMSTGKSKFKKKMLDSTRNSESVFDRFHGSNNTIHKSL